MRQLFFTYGTLQRGNARHHILEKVGAEFLGSATTMGEYLLKDRKDFPFMVQTDKHTPDHREIRGELYLVPPTLFHELDYVEGHPDFFKRVNLTVRSDDGGFPKQATAYVITPDKADKPWYKPNIIDTPLAENGRWNKATSTI